ncbi:TAXI family TRAP transporter solute-binding subunit [Phormidium tenue]|uniref:C4-dicarboxylate ABC transporter substrate-binding protein n=1 Tax=Phormidium tenue NIES-30 TaxID=549789 RepID=A0A1U7J8W6_9CYAN|nr:TAXI family TRAP transporter solute-binding subunit [Phormidium tenue]MBD2231027.1 TAXI family TRAP transporter solute-binding subunit [Phormidium tenue FACHB-1052]OKH49940.1 C4-dicarboxylate ABC transporter substrate-binding protein [Phormidium tenue NIES-30]
MQGKLVLPVVVLSLVGVVASAFFLVREHTRTYRLVLASGGSTGEYYAFSQAFAEVVARNHPTIAIEVLETNGSLQNMDLLKTNAAQLALVQSDTPVQPPVRAVALLFPELFHLLAHTDADINGVADLRGKRVALMPEGSGSYALFWPLVQHYGLGADTMTVLPMPADQAHAALAAGEVDALFRVITLGNPAVGELLQTSTTRLIPIDQADALQLSLPYLEAQIIPKGTYNGGRPVPAADLPVVAVNALLVAHEALPPKVVNALTRTLHQNRNELVALYPRAARIRLDTSGDLGLPLHSGAEAFYSQGEPEFLVEYAEPIGLLLSVGVLAMSSLWQLRSWLLGKQKNRADTYNLEILALIDEVDKAQSLEELNALREKLFDILKRVVSDLDVDRITSESFESFTFPWEIANNTLRHQEMVLRSNAGEADRR